VAATWGEALAQTPTPSPQEDAGASAASAVLNSPDGEQVGQAKLTQTPNGVLLHVDLRDLPAGSHGFHIHEIGACEPTFEAAGGHYAPGKHAHGYLNDDGHHAGDMPNIFVPESGALTFEVINRNISLNSDVQGTVFDSNGSAIVIHTNPDDYKSQPSGDAGERIACGIIEKG
jgi:Cu-Zn family superoxide dismutase